MATTLNGQRDVFILSGRQSSSKLSGGLVPGRTRSATGRKQKTVWLARAGQTTSNEAALARLQWLLGVSAYPSLYLRDRHGCAQNGRL
jgi:hypothetical protein